MLLSTFTTAHFSSYRCVFTARRCTGVVYAVIVCLSVRHKTAEPSITQATPCNSQGPYFSVAKDLSEITIGSTSVGTPNRWASGVGYIWRFSTNVSLCLTNSYRGRLIGTRMSRTQPTDNKPSLIGAWSRYVIH